MKSVELRHFDRAMINQNIRRASFLYGEAIRLERENRAIAKKLSDNALGDDKEAYLSLPKELRVSCYNISVFSDSTEIIFYLKDGDISPVNFIIYDDLPKDLQSIVQIYVEAKNNLEKEEKKIEEHIKKILNGFYTTGELEANYIGVSKYYPDDLKQRIAEPRCFKALKGEIDDLKKALKH
ncbi:MAG: hypothetical protein COB69_00250 [Phycisphaera sp.]|nr:MAG: hypothetical protein COB69_00250 [Phycisphaera sp.]